MKLKLYFAVHLKLTQHGKSTILQFTKKKKQEKLFHSYKETNANTLKQKRFSAGFSKHLLKPEDFNRLQGWEWGLEVLSTF